MTIHAQLTPQSRRPSLDPHRRAPAHERATHGLDASQADALDAFVLLDPRTRQSTVPRDMAPPGRYLSVEDGEQERLIPLARPIVHLGRGLTSDVRLEDPQVSRRHAIIAQRGDGARVLDDRSSNGTFVNGRAVTVAYVSDGDVLRVGRAVFRFVTIEPAVKSSPVRRRIPLPVRAPGAAIGTSA